MSKTSIDFFNDISTQASGIMKLMEQSQRGSSSQLVKFEKDFKVGWFGTYTVPVLTNSLIKSFLPIGTCYSRRASCS
jgi:hypothetical protein